ncbi:MAG: phosphatidylserine decarboxylase [Bacteroidota bacterium]|nr:phosphatidylserine decarboxylase [Candidatus Kapabacteria bacterium]MDW8219963.1 phosphatidylserine decarboxylase [Bacteroidota bacterium]
MITRYGYDNFFALLAGSMMLVVFGIQADMSITRHVLIVLGIGVAAFAFWFFRNPRRRIPAEALSDDSIVLAPADGTIVRIVTTDEPRLIQGIAIQISIFLSPLDVHVNRIPANGEIVFSDYKPGKFLIATNHRASEENEQTIIGLVNSKGAIVFKQLTGVLARRIVNEAHVGQRYSAGEEFGMMKFGSRMDILVPETADVRVSVGQRVVGGETILCQLR